jgi:anti-anti-sigma regulatory factor
MDSTAMVNLRSLADALKQRGIRLYLLSPKERIKAKLLRFGLGNGSGNVVVTNDPMEIE